MNYKYYSSFILLFILSSCSTNNNSSYIKQIDKKRIKGKNLCITTINASSVKIDNHLFQFKRIGYYDSSRINLLTNKINNINLNSLKTKTTPSMKVLSLNPTIVTTDTFVVIPKPTGNYDPDPDTLKLAFAHPSADYAKSNNCNFTLTYNDIIFDTTISTGNNEDYKGKQYFGTNTYKSVRITASYLLFDVDSNEAILYGRNSKSLEFLHYIDSTDLESLTRSMSTFGINNTIFKNRSTP